jgi:polyisoprenoid-binding protein YceI
MFRRRFSAIAAGVMALASASALAAPRPSDAEARATSTPATSPSGAVRPLAVPPLRFVVAPTGNEARYRVREQLAGFDFPNDAVGVTSAITGAVVVDEQGNMVPAESRVVVELTPLRSDQDRRDNYLRRRTLQTETHPTVTLVPTAVRGLSLGSAPAGEQTFELVADLTVKGVTRPTTWSVTATFAGDRVTGSAATAFTFEEFGLDKPRVARVLSVADTIRLEYDFSLVRQQ